MSASRWSAVVQHIATRRIVAELPIESAHVSSIRNAPGSLSVSIPLASTVGLRPVDVEERRNAIILRRDDAVIGAGIIETFDADIAANSLSIGCVGWFEWLRHVHLRRDRTFSGADQASIVAALVAEATAKSGAIPWSVAAPATGRLRDRSWAGWERQPIGKLIEELAAVIDGFGFRVETDLVDGAYQPRLVTSYPATGRETNIVLQVGSNVELLGVSGAGDSMVTDVEMIGSGQGPEAPIVAASDPNLLSVSPVWEAVETHADVTEPSTLSEKAGRRLALGRAPIRLPKIRLGLDADPPLGSYVVGDQARVIAHHGLIDIDDIFVITQIDVDISRTAETVDLTVAPISAFRDAA